jgi:Cu/Ag efflux protein CusF
MVSDTLTAPVRPALMALAMALSLAGILGATARGTAYWSPIHAIVLSVDRRHHTVTIRHEALETEPAGVRVCVVRNPHSLAQLRSGELIEARAQTSKATWTLDGIRVVGRSGSTTLTPRRMALL